MTVELEFPHLVDEMKKQAHEFNISSPEDIFIETDLDENNSGEVYIKYNGMTWIFSRNHHTGKDKFTIDVYKGHISKNLGIVYEKSQPEVLHATQFTGVHHNAFLWNNSHPEYGIKRIPTEELAQRLLTKIIITKAFRSL